MNTLIRGLFRRAFARYQEITTSAIYHDVLEAILGALVAVLQTGLKRF